MKNETLPVIYEDENLLVIDKPAGLISDNFPKRVHRLDKDTSGVLLIAKNKKALKFLQKQFKENQVEKKYILLVVGKLKAKRGKIETFFARGGKDRRKQKVFSPLEPGAKRKKLRLAITEYKVIKEYKEYSLVEALPKTGRRHQIRAHFAYLGNPVAGDNLYGFKDSPCPKGLKRQSLHASYLKIKLPDGELREFRSKLPSDLKKVLKNL
jgi:23S rRNA pseudouridine1911/1915/1917 synthase